MKSILIEEELHEKLKYYSKKSGIKIKILVEASIENYLKKMKLQENEEQHDRRN